MSLLFTPLKLRELEFKNRIFVSPMCQYSAREGVPNEWHLVHLGSRAVGGAGLVLTEATAISPEGRISAEDTGLWNEEQTKAFKPIVDFIKSQGARAGIQLAHAGRKASNKAPWFGSGPLSLSEGGWVPVGPSALPFSPSSPRPREMNEADMKKVIQDFINATQRSRQAGFEVIEIHMAHGYLLNEFLSPLANQRRDSYGGSLENRMRFPLEVARAVRDNWPTTLPLFVRISATDWVEGGWDVNDSVVFAKELKNCGIDLMDCSSGGNSAHAKIDAKPGYQVPFAERVRKEAGLPTAAVGLITTARHAEEILKSGQADAVFLARELLRDPYWPLRAAHELNFSAPWPKQYERAAYRRHP